MSFNINQGLLCFLLVLPASLSGCGAESDQPDLGLVKGVISFEGKPMAGASVTFKPDSGRPAMAKTDESGYYELIYIRNTPGCKVGRNKVIIYSVVEGEDSLEMEGDDAPDAAVGPAKEKLPARYNNETELVVDVQPGENTFDFDLKK